MASKIAAQLYTVRNFTKTAEDLEVTLRKIRDIGYEAVQVSGIGPIDPKIVKKLADDNGLKIIATHNSFERLVNETEAVIEEHLLWNCKYAGVGSMPQSYRVDKDGFVRFAKEASEVGRKLAEAGLKFVYHNHNFEFAKFDGKTGLEILFEESDPKALYAELDTYWVQAGGANPTSWIKRMKGRMDIIHLKDMTIHPLERKQMFAEVGEGNLEWDKIIEACKENNIEWYIVEQDTCQRAPFESLAISLRNLKAMGVE